MTTSGWLEREPEIFRFNFCLFSIHKIEDVLNVETFSSFSLHKFDENCQNFAGLLDFSL